MYKWWGGGNSNPKGLLFFWGGGGEGGIIQSYLLDLADNQVLSVEYLSRYRIILNYLNPLLSCPFKKYCIKRRYYGY